MIFYLFRTKNFVIKYFEKLNFNIFNCASDAVFENDEMIRKNSDDYLFQLYERIVDWRAIKQITIITFSIEAELLIIFRIEKKVIWWKQFFEFIKFDTKKKLVIKCDNRQTIRILIKEVMKLNTKFRHVDVHQHWLRQKMQTKRINVSWIFIIEMSINGLTKMFSK